MKLSNCLIVSVMLMCGLVARAADAPPEMPKPQKEHEWLKQLEGEWTAEIEAYMDPSQPPMKMKGTETARMIGGFWIQGEHKGSFMEQPFTGIMTLGYDPEKKSYVGSWVDSMSNYMWTYTGKVDETGKILTLESTGPCPMAGGKPCKFKEVMELKGPDHKVFTSSVELEGKWVLIMKSEARRTKK